MKRLMTVVAAATIAASSCSAYATILGGGDAMFSWTTDTSTGLDWLDFDGGPAPTTIERPYNEVAVQLGPGGDYEGWRLASRAEIYQFLLNITAYPFLTLGWSTHNDGATGLVAAWTGYSRHEGTLDILSGFSGDLFVSCCDPDSPYFVGLANPVVESDEPADFYTVNTANPTGSYVGMGSWLVRGQAQAVPEPATLALVGLGLAGLGLFRRRSAPAILTVRDAARLEVGSAVKRSTASLCHWCA